MIELLDDPQAPTLDGRHGAYTRRYAYGRVGERRVTNALNTGTLVCYGRSVLMDATRVLDVRTRSAAAQLLTGGTIVSPTAVTLHGCTAVSAFPIHIRLPYDQRVRSRPGLVIHQGGLGPDDTTMVDGLRVLTPDLAIAEALCTESRRAALACTDELLRAMRPDDRAGFVSSVTQRLTLRADRRGTRRARELLGLATGLPECPSQSGFLLLLVDAGLPRPLCQYEVAGHRLDFAWPARQVALQYESHHTPEEPRHDNLRGWTVFRADAQDLADPIPLCARIRGALRDHDRVAA